jgi:hypothetical protein
MKLYVASSWRNEYQPNVVAALRGRGHEVYDFRNPKPDDHGFSWKQVDGGWESWTPYQYVRALDHPISVAGFDNDFSAMEWAEGGVLVLPCGRSAHIEAGYFVGANKPLFILMFDRQEPELMYRMASAICLTIDELFRKIADREGGPCIA